MACPAGFFFAQRKTNGPIRSSSEYQRPRSEATQVTQLDLLRGQCRAIPKTHQDRCPCGCVARGRHCGLASSSTRCIGLRAPACQELTPWMPQTLISLQSTTILTTPLPSVLTRCSLACAGNSHCADTPFFEVIRKMARSPIGLNAEARQGDWLPLKLQQIFWFP